MNIDDRFIYTNAFGTVSVVVPAKQFFDSMVCDAVVDEVTGEELEPAITEDDCWQIILDKEKKNHAIQIEMKKKMDEGMTEAEVASHIKKVHATLKPVNIPDVEAVTKDKIPADRTFRNAWKKGAAKVEIDMPKALEIAKNKVREVREKKWSGVDAEFNRSLETGDETAKDAAVAKKNTLRDAPADTRLTDAKTPDDLKLAMGAVINEIEQL